ncbi:MAG TPA: tRNA (guanosine(46)-N7)-methyltransferase TrmB [Candidatus Saccharimonadales bacterium]
MNPSKAKPEDFIIVKKRKKYKFARFSELPNCYETKEFTPEVRDDFLRHRSLTIELGAGTGHFSLELARRHPARAFIAVDVKADRLYQGARIAAEEDITNICFTRAHANQLLDVFNSHSVSELWLTFPDPYPKKRAAKHRMTHPYFLDIYEQLLQKAGMFHFKTDNQPFFLWSLEQLVAKKMQLTFLTFDLHESEAPGDYKVQTVYEKRYSAESKPIWALDVVM